MPAFNLRRLAPLLIVLLLLGAVVGATSLGKLPPADFTFCNGDEVKTLDPARASGQPEGNLIRALFQGLCDQDAATLKPTPGVAERWEISEPDRLTYTFHLRSDARWSNGDPVTAEDFVWSYRRFLHPGTGSEYSYEMWYVVGAENYTKATVAIGDLVEVELAFTPDEAGQTLRGKLVARQEVPADASDSDDTAAQPLTVYRIEIDGVARTFEQTGQRGEKCQWVLPDFDSVAIKALDARTVQIKLKHPVPYFLDLLAFYPMSPVHRGCVEAHGYPWWTKPENIVSNGAFRLEFRRIRDRVRLAKSETYWDRDNIHLNSIDALAVKSIPTQLNLYLTGEADWITKIPSTVVPEIIAQKRTDFSPTPFLATYYYRLNVTKPPLNDPSVRRALNMAIDKQAICEHVSKKGETPARSLVPAGIVAYSPYRPAETDPYDVEGARRLLAEAGYPRGRGFPRVDLLYNTDENHRAIAEVIQQQLQKNLGIQIGLVNQEWAAYQEAMKQLNYDMARAGWIGDYTDPNTFLNMFVTDGPNNQTGWGNAEYDRLVAAAQVEPDERARLDKFRAAETILMGELPLIPIYFYTTPDMVRPWVKNFPPNILNMHSFDGVWIDREEKRRVLAAERP